MDIGVCNAVWLTLTQNHSHLQGPGVWWDPGAAQLYWRLAGGCGLHWTVSVCGTLSGQVWKAQDVCLALILKLHVSQTCRTSFHSIFVWSCKCVCVHFVSAVATIFGHILASRSLLLFQENWKIKIIIKKTPKRINTTTFPLFSICCCHHVKLVTL